MVDAVIFDVDGTLIDSVDAHAHAWVEALAQFDHKVPFEAVRAQIGKGGDQLMPVFVGAVELARIGGALDDFRSRLFKSRYLPKLKPFPGVRALFSRLKELGVRVALASSSKADELEHYKKLAHIEDLLEGETSAADADKSKPNPDIVRAAMQELGSPSASRVMLVGDSPWDAFAASRIGVRTIGFRCGGFADMVLRSAGCIALYDDPADLLAKLSASPIVRDEENRAAL